MLRDGRRALGVGLGHSVKINMVTQQKTQGRRVGVIMIIGTCLMSKSRIKSHAFVDISIPVPDPIAPQSIHRISILSRAIRVREGITIIEERDSVHPHPNRTCIGQGFRQRHHRRAR